MLHSGCLYLSRFTCGHLNSQCDGAGGDEGGVFLMGWGPWWSRSQRAAPRQVRTQREDPCPLPGEDMEGRPCPPCPTPLDPDLKCQPPEWKDISVCCFTSLVCGIWLYLPQLRQNSLFAFSLKILVILLVGKKLLKIAHNLSLGSDLISFILIRHKFLTLMNRISCMQWVSQIRQHWILEGGRIPPFSSLD